MLLLHPSITQNRGLSVFAPHTADDVEIRLAQAADIPALNRLSELDSRPAGVLHGDVLLAEVHGDTVAALSLDDDLLVTDPFHHTKPIAQLLDLRARQLRAA